MVVYAQGGALGCVILPFQGDAGGIMNCFHVILLAMGDPFRVDGVVGMKNRRCIPLRFMYLRLLRGVPFRDRRGDPFRVVGLFPLCYLMPSFLAMVLGMASLWMRMLRVLYFTNALEAYQIPL